jgi:anti-sigma B factor antagonist
MALSATTSVMGKVTVVRLSGPIVFGDESAYLRTLVKDLLAHSPQIVLDLGEVSYIDSGGLGTLVGLYASAHKAGGDIRLARVGPRPNEVLHITKLVTLFEVFDKTSDAVSSFNRAAAAQR